MTVYEVITNRIIALLEQGTAPWRKTWSAESRPRNLVSGKPYRGINVFLLLAAGGRFASPCWLTFRQALQAGGNVRKGEQGLPVVFWKPLDKSAGAQSDETEEQGRRRAPLLRYFTVFNVEQCDGLTAPATASRSFDPIPEAARIIAAMKNPPAISHGGDRAWYRPSTDAVRLPLPGSFISPAHYYSTAFHELAHSTGHGSRLDRKGITDETMFGDHDYSREELIAEMTAAFLCGSAGLDTADVMDNTSAYLAHWIKVLRGDTRLVVTAAAAAQKAADHILGTTFATTEEESNSPALEAA